MPDAKISALPTGTTPQATDEFVVARAGGNNKLTWSQLIAGMFTSPGAALSAGELVRGGGAGAVPSTSGAATVTAGTVTTAISPLSITETRNAAGVTFPGVVYNVTETASAAGSNLLDLKVGGTSQFQVHKTGAVVITGNGTTWGFDADNASASWLLFSRGWTGSAFSNPEFGVNWSDQIVLKAAMQFAWSSAGGPTNTPDLFLTRAGAASLRLGAPDAASPIAQTLQVQSVIAGTFNTAGAIWTFNGSRGTGTGAGGDIIWQVAPAGSSGTLQNALVERLRVSAGSTAVTVTGGLNVTATGRFGSSTVALLPSASASGSGARYHATDASTTKLLGQGTVVAAGGANFVPLYSDGTNWIID